MQIPEKAKLLIGLSTVCASLAANEYCNPTTHHPTGRYSWLFGPIFEKFGPKGILIYWVAVSALLALASILNIWRNK